MTWQVGLGVVALLALGAVLMVWPGRRPPDRRGPDGAGAFMTSGMADATRRDDRPGGPDAQSDDAAPDGANDTGDGSAD